MYIYYSFRCIYLLGELAQIDKSANKVAQLLPLLAKATSHRQYTQHVHFLESFCKQVNSYKYLHTVTEFLPESVDWINGTRDITGESQDSPKWVVISLGISLEPAEQASTYSFPIKLRNRLKIKIQRCESFTNLAVEFKTDQLFTIFVSLHKPASEWQIIWFWSLYSGFVTSLY